MDCVGHPCTFFSSRTRESYIRLAAKQSSRRRTLPRADCVTGCGKSSQPNSKVIWSTEEDHAGHSDGHASSSFVEHVTIRERELRERDTIESSRRALNDTSSLRILPTFPSQNTPQKGRSIRWLRWTGQRCAILRPLFDQSRIRHPISIPTPSTSLRPNLWTSIFRRRLASFALRLED